MKKALIGMTITVIALLTTTMPAIAGWDPGCGCTHSRLLGPPPSTTVNTNAAQAVAGAASQSASEAVGIGGTGGAGGLGMADASTGNVSSDVNNSNNLQAGSSSSTASGNGANIAYSAYFPMQVPELPPTIVTGGITLVKSGTCGPRVKVLPFKRKRYTPEVFGIYQKGDEVQSLQGRIEGLAKKPFIYKTVVLPQPLGGKKIFTAWGDQLYVTVGNDGQGGGSGGAANYASRTAVGLGAALNANSTYGIVGEVAVRCLYAQSEAEPKVPPVALRTSKTDVLAAGGKYHLFKKPQGPTLCGGKRIPPGYYCGFIRNHVPVVKDVTLK